MANLPIGALAKQTGVKVPTIRYYESVGLLPEPTRSDSNRRVYGADTVQRLRFIRHARELGFEIDSIRQLMSLAKEPRQPCKEADAIARLHLAEIDGRISRLVALRAEVQRMVDQCERGRVEDCRVIEILADHSQCLVEAHGRPASL